MASRDTHPEDWHDRKVPEDRRDIMRRQCPQHDPGKHWHDDYNYVFGTEDGEENPPTWRDCIKLVRNSVKLDEKIHKFAVVYVREDGILKCMASPGIGHHGSVNLLAKAISIMAYQKDAEEQRQQQQSAQFGRNRTLGHEYLHKEHNGTSMHRLSKYLPNGGKCAHRASFPP